MKIWWIGTGVMGSSMAMHLLKAGHEIYVYNRTKEKTNNLLENWAMWKDTISDLVNCVDVLFTIIWTPEDVRNVYLSDNGLINNCKKWLILVDMTTTSPSLTVEIYNKAKEKWIEFLDAPVSWWDIWARNWTLSIMVWWDENIFEKINPLFQLMWKNIVYEWSSGSGQHTKLSNQIVIAWTMIGICESLLYASKAWLDLEKLVASISKWAAWCRSLDNLAPRIIRGEYDTWFYVEHFVKDMWIALEEARKLNLSLPGLALVNQLYIAIKAQWWSKLWTQSLIKALKTLNNI